MFQPESHLTDRVGRAAFLFNLIRKTAAGNSIQLVSLINPAVVEQTASAFMRSTPAFNCFSRFGKQLELIPPEFAQSITPDEVVNIPHSSIDVHPRQAVEYYQTLLVLGYFLINLGHNLASNPALTPKDQNQLVQAVTLTNLGASFWLGAENYLRPHSYKDGIKQNDYLPPDEVINLAEKVIQVKRIRSVVIGDNYKSANEDAIINNIFHQLMPQLQLFPNITNNRQASRRIKQILSNINPKYPEIDDLLFLKKQLPPEKGETDYADFLFKSILYCLQAHPKFQDRFRESPGYI